MVGDHFNSSENVNSTLMNYIERTWIEQPAFGIFRIWHIMFMSGSILLFIIIIFCCCVKIRIPRTKQEIEADYQRKKLARKFRQQLKKINNQEMDAMDLKKALDRIQQEFKSDTESDLDPFQSISINSTSLPADANISSSDSSKLSHCQGTMKAEPQHPLNRTFSQKVAALVKMSKLRHSLKDDNEYQEPK